MFGSRKTFLLDLGVQIYLFFLGIALGQLMDSLSISALRPFHYMAVSAGLTFLAWATYALLQALGINPQWSLALALKHCAFREWVHLDTSLFYALVRDLASLIGEVM